MKYDNKQKLAVMVLLLALIFVVGSGLIYQNNRKPKYQPLDKQVSNKEVKLAEEEEPSESYVLVNKVTFSYPNRVTVRIYDNGDVEKSTVIDELIAPGVAPQDTFVKEKKLTKEQITQITDAIEVLKNTPKTETINEDYGLSINVDKDLVSVQIYNQEAIDTFNTLIDELIN